MRLLVALIGGIMCGDYLINIGSGLLPIFFLKLDIALLLLLAVVHAVFPERISKWLFGIVLYIFIASSGAYLILDCQRDIRDKLPDGKAYIVAIADIPQLKENSVMVDAMLLSVIDSSRHVTRAKRQTLRLYLAKDSASTALGLNDKLIISVRPSPPHNDNNIFAFDNREYLYNNGISATAYIDSLHWLHVGNTGKLSIRQQALIYRSKVVEMYRNLGFTEDGFAVLSALTIGCRDTIDRELRDSYSIAGASHLLAISGMHVGLICTILMFLLRPLRMLPGGATLSTITAITLLWCYTYFIGLTASAVRATIMLSFYLLSKLLRRDALSLNNVFVTAFIMLLFRPAWLFDVGFQLSFAAVLSILTFYPLLSKLYTPGNIATRYLWGIITVSIAAQIGTAPLVIHHFCRFPTHFLLTNIAIVPLMTIIVGGAMIVLLPIPVLNDISTVIVDWSLRILNGAISLIEHLPHSSIEGVYLNNVEVAIVYLAIVSFYSYCIWHNGKRLLLSLGLVVIFLGIHITYAIVQRPSTEIMLYNHYGNPIVHCISTDRRSWVVVPDSIDSGTIRRSSFASGCGRLHINPPSIVHSGDISDGPAVYNQIVSYRGKMVCILNDNRWNHCRTTSPLSVDYIYICRGFRGSISKVMPLFAVRHVVLDSSLSPNRRRRYKEECAQLGLQCLSIYEEGSVAILL